MQTLAQILVGHNLDHPDQVSLVLQSAGQPDTILTYRELVKGATSYAQAYSSRGIIPGEVVVLILQPGIDLVYAFWGAVLHGAIPSIMPFLTEKLIPERYRADLASLVSITRPAAIVTYASFAGEVHASLQPHGLVHSDQASPQPESPVRAVILVEDARMSDISVVMQLEGLRRAGEDIVLLQHSSGTTGLQKGVALSNRSVLNQLDNYGRTLKVTEEDVVVSWLPLYHDMGLIAGFLMPILLGVRLVLMSPFDWVRAPQRLLQAVAHYKGTLSWLPNFAYNFCAQKIRDRQIEGLDLSSWRLISNCSEPMRWESHQRFYERFKMYGLRENALATCYAMAENVFAVTQGGVEDVVRVDLIDRDMFQEQRFARPAGENGKAIRMLSAGRPIQGTQVKVVSADGSELGDRHVGELALRSDCMLSGYYRRPDETAKAFLDGWYLTGDYGYIADGEVYVSGRKKDLLIIAGKNVYPQDLEALAMEVPGIHPGRTVAFGVFNEESGTEEAVIVAEVDCEDSEQRAQIAAQVSEVVTRGSAVALRVVYLVEPKWLIKTSSGKIARLANREKYLAATMG